MKKKYIPLAGVVLLALGQQIMAADDESSVWSKESQVLHGTTTVVQIRARVVGDVLQIELKHQPEWHTYAMDNEKRAKEKLAGQMSLGIQEGLSVQIKGDVKQTKGWFQSKPTDYSDPEIRWYAWGFSGTSMLATQVDLKESASLQIAISGQACNESACIIINESIEVPVTRSDDDADIVDWKSLVEVEEVRGADKR